MEQQYYISYKVSFSTPVLPENVYIITISGEIFRSDIGKVQTENPCLF